MVGPSNVSDENHVKFLEWKLLYWPARNKDAVDMESEIRCFILNQSEFPAFSAIISDTRHPQTIEIETQPQREDITDNNNN